MEMVLDVLNLNTSRKIIRAWFFFLGFTLFLNFSGIEDQFETGQLQIVKSTDLYCTSVQVTAKSSSSDKAFEPSFFVSTALTSETSSASAALVENKVSILIRESVLELSKLNRKPLGVFDFSKPARAPPLA